MAVFMAGLAHAIGERRLISDIGPVATEPDLLSSLHSVGLKHYRHADSGPMELATTCVEQTISESGIQARDIDAVMIATSSLRFGQIEDGELLAFSERLGLTGATILGISGAECANFGSALRLARAQIAAGDAQNLLLVTTDVCADDSQRLLGNVMSIASDGAASCLISSTQNRIEVVATTQGTQQLIRAARERHMIAGLTRRGLSAVADRAFIRAGVDRSEVRCVITNNVNTETIRVIADSAGLPHELCYLDNLVELGHVHSADNLINLQTFIEDGVGSGDVIMMISHGFGTWGVALLRLH